MGKNGFIIFCLVFSSAALADNRDTCSSLLNAIAKQQIKQLDFFPFQKKPVFISICRSQGPRVFEQFYTYLNPGKSPTGNAPLTALTRVKQILKPSHDVFATGVLAFSAKNTEQYQLRVRVRINQGDATDLSVDLPLHRGQVLTAKDKGFEILLIHTQPVSSDQSLQ